MRRCKTTPERKSKQLLVGAVLSVLERDDLVFPLKYSCSEIVLLKSIDLRCTRRQLHVSCLEIMAKGNCGPKKKFQKWSEEEVPKKTVQSRTWTCDNVNRCLGPTFV
jgi:hypothetical protein